ASSDLGPQQIVQRLRDLDRKAQEEIQRRAFAEAARTFREATCLAPQDARLHYGLGVAEAAAGNLLLSRHALEEAHRLSPDNTLPLAMLVKVNLEMGETGDVKEQLRDAARRFPRNGKLHVDLARLLLERQQLDLALAEGLRAEQGGEKDPQLGV